MMENLVKFSNEGFMLVASVAKGDRHILINYCVVPDNIHSPAPPHGGQRKFRGEGGGVPEGRNFRGGGIFFCPYHKLKICDKQLAFA